MTLTKLILQIILTIPLTIILKLIDKKTSTITKIIVPTVYIIILSALTPYIKNSIFLIVVFEIFIRNFYNTNITREHTLKSNTLFILESLISVSLSLFAYNTFISKVDTVIPNPEEIKPFLWFLIIIFIYMIYKNLTKDKEVKKIEKTMELKTENIIMDYAKYKNKYSVLVNSENKMVNDLTYAIMIYNIKNKPAIYRKLTEYKGIITRKEVPYGIMQIKSFNNISDEESIRLTILDLEDKYNNTDKKLENMLSNYNEEERKNIISIYAEIVEFQKK